jgi:hypothetical protein
VKQEEKYKTLEIHRYGEYDQILSFKNEKDLFEKLKKKNPDFPEGEYFINRDQYVLFMLKNERSGYVIGEIKDIDIGELIKERQMKKMMSDKKVMKMGKNLSKMGKTIEKHEMSEIKIIKPRKVAMKKGAY